MVPGCLCAGHPVREWGENGRWREAQWSLPPHPAVLSFPSSLTHFALLLSPQSSSSSSLPSLNGGSSLVISLKPIISSPPTSIPGQPLNNNTQPLDQSPKRAGSLIDAYQRIHCC